MGILKKAGLFLTWESLFDMEQWTDDGHAIHDTQAFL